MEGMLRSQPWGFKRNLKSYHLLCQGVQLAKRKLLSPRRAPTNTQLYLERPPERISKLIPFGFSRTTFAGSPFISKGDGWAAVFAL